jgi:predicted DNA binding CopG/RHH family protein
MKPPKLSDLRFDRRGTEQIRSAMARAKKIHITINIDVESLQQLRQMADERGVPYQRLLSQALGGGLVQQDLTEARLTRLEQEFKKLKRQLAA